MNLTTIPIQLTRIVFITMLVLVSIGHSTTLSIEAPPQVLIDEGFRADVKIYNTTDLAGFEIDIEFDPAEVELTGITLGSFNGSADDTDANFWRVVRQAPDSIRSFSELAAIVAEANANGTIRNVIWAHLSQGGIESGPEGATLFSLDFIQRSSNVSGIWIGDQTKLSNSSAELIETNFDGLSIDTVPVVVQRTTNPASYSEGWILTVSLTTTVAADTGLVLFALEENLPPGWTYLADSANNGGVFNTGDDRVSWTTTSIESTTFSFQMQAPAAEIEESYILSGSAGYTFGGPAFDASPEHLEIFEISTHPGDTDFDFKITIFEYLAFAGPVAAAYQEGIDGGSYQWNGTQLTALTSPGPVGVFHGADENTDARISIFEFIAYAGPIAAVYQQGINSGSYEWDGATLTPKISE
jgi:hypothetical protein